MATEDKEQVLVALEGEMRNLKDLIDPHLRSHLRLHDAAPPSTPLIARQTWRTARPPVGCRR
jgi:hypothetical protein